MLFFGKSLNLSMTQFSHLQNGDYSITMAHRLALGSGNSSWVVCPMDWGSPHSPRLLTDRQLCIFYSTSWHPKDTLFVLPWNLALRLNELKTKDSDKIRRVFKGRQWLPSLGGPDPPHCPHQLFIYLRCIYWSWNMYVFCTYCERFQFFNAYSMSDTLLVDLRLLIRILSTAILDRFYILNLQIRKMRQRKVTQLSQGHITIMLLRRNVTCQNLSSHSIILPRNKGKGEKYPVPGFKKLIV